MVEKTIVSTRTDNRVLILGSRMSGAYEIGETFQKYLKFRSIPQIRVEVLRDVNGIEEAILEGSNLPKGIILLPEVRQYSLGGMGTTLRTYEDGVNNCIESLCEKYNIPLHEIREYKSPKQIEEGLKNLLEPTNN